MWDAKVRKSESEWVSFVFVFEKNKNCFLTRPILGPSKNTDGSDKTSYMNKYEKSRFYYKT